MKDPTLVTTYLDHCAEMQSLKARDENAWLDAIEFDPRIGESWQAALNDGWTVEEMDDAYERRFGRRPRREGRGIDVR
jgi:hypothetical protein